MVALGRDAAVAARLLTTYTPTLRVAKSVEPVALRRAGPAADEAVGAGLTELAGRGGGSRKVSVGRVPGRWERSSRELLLELG